jgi:hypothetical protein
MDSEITAHLGMTVTTKRGLVWDLYVSLPEIENSLDFPGCELPAPLLASIPAVTVRADALKRLGYEPVPGARWTWRETPFDEDKPASLLGSINVRPIKEEKING